MKKLKERTEFFTSEDVVEGSYAKDYTNQIVVISKDHVENNFVKEYRTPENQLFLARGGFGVDPNKMGTAVFGKFISDGEETRMDRPNFIGILKPELVKKYGLKGYAYGE